MQLCGPDDTLKGEESLEIICFMKAQLEFCTLGILGPHNSNWGE